MKNRDIYWRRYKVQETWYTGDTSVSFKVGTSGHHTALPVSLPLFKTPCKIFCWNCHQLPCRIFLNLIYGLKSLPFQRWFQFWEKPEVTGHQIWAVRGLSHLGDSMFCQKTLLKTWCVSGRECCCDEAANHQLPIASAFWVIQIVSRKECSNLTQNLMQILCPTLSGILNATATQYTCSLNSIYHPHWLVQWSRHCSHMCIPVHSPWLPGYIDVTWTILLDMLTMTGLFPDRPCMSPFPSGSLMTS